MRVKSRGTGSTGGRKQRNLWNRSNLAREQTKHSGSREQRGNFSTLVCKNRYS